MRDSSLPVRQAETWDGMICMNFSLEAWYVSVVPCLHYDFLNFSTDSQDVVSLTDSRGYRRQVLLPSFL